MYSLIVTAKMNDVDPQAWLADVLARIAGHPAQKLDELLPWNWTPLKTAEAAAARAAWLTEWILFDVRPEAWSVSSRRVSDEAEASLQSIRLHSMARALTRLRLLRPDFDDLPPEVVEDNRIGPDNRFSGGHCDGFSQVDGGNTPLYERFA